MPLNAEDILCKDFLFCLPLFIFYFSPENEFDQKVQV